MVTVAQPNPATLERIIQTVGELPSSPEVLSSALELAGDLDTGVDRLSEVLASDQVLAAKVLRLSNSPFYGRTRQIGTLAEAVLVLGYHTIRSLVVATATQTLFKSGGHSARETQLWEHSLACAMAARLLARRLQHPAVEEAFIAGLVHDIGWLLIWQRLPAQYDEITRKARERKHASMRTEQEVLGFTHAHLGATILEHWNFPPDICRAVHWQPDPERADTTPDRVSLLSIVRFADSLVCSLGYGFHPEQVVALKPCEPPEPMGLTPDDVTEVSESLVEHYNEARAHFDT